MAEKEGTNKPPSPSQSPLQLHFYSDNKGWTTIDPNVPMSQQPAAGSWFASQSANDKSNFQPMHIQSTMGKGPDQPGQRGVIITSNPADRTDRQSPLHALFFDTDQSAERIPPPPGFSQFPGQIAPDFAMDHDWNPCTPCCPGFDQNTMPTDSTVMRMSGSPSFTVASTINIGGGQGPNEGAFTVQHTSGTSSRPNTPGENAHNLGGQSPTAITATDINRNNNCGVQAVESQVASQQRKVFLESSIFCRKDAGNCDCFLLGIPSGDEQTDVQGTDYTAHSAPTTCWDPRQSFGPTLLTMNNNTGQNNIPQNCACHNHAMINPTMINHQLQSTPWQFPPCSMGCSHHPYQMADPRTLQQPFYPAFGEHHNYPNALYGACHTNYPPSHAVLPMSHGEAGYFVQEQQPGPTLTYSAPSGANAAKSRKPGSPLLCHQLAAPLSTSEAKKIPSKLIDRSCQTNLSAARPGQIGAKGRPVTSIVTDDFRDGSAEGTAKQTHFPVSCFPLKATQNKVNETDEDKVSANHFNRLHHGELLDGPPVERITYLATTDLNASHDIGAFDKNNQPSERIHMYTNPLVMKHTESHSSDTILTAFVKAASRRVDAEMQRVNQVTGALH